MSPALLTYGACAALLLAGGAALWMLPWRDAEVERVARAFRRMAGR